MTYHKAKLLYNSSIFPGGQFSHVLTGNNKKIKTTKDYLANLNKILFYELLRANHVDYSHNYIIL